MIAIDCSGLTLLIFEEKLPNYASGPHQTVTRFDYVGLAFLCMRAVVLCPKFDNFAYLHTLQDQNELHLKR